MPIAHANGKKFTFPEGTTPEQMGQAIDEYFSSTESQAVPTEKSQAAEQAPPQSRSLGNGYSDAVAELAAAANKGIFEALDFLGPNNVNAIAELAGSKWRMPTLSGTLGDDGGYMEPGLARDAVQASGKLLVAGAGLAPVAGRNLNTVKGAAEEVLGLGSAKIAEPIKTATSAISDALPSKAKDAAKLPLYKKSGDVAAAGFKLDDAGKVIPDKLQKNAIKAGVDEGAVAMIAAANKATKSRLKEMVEVLEKGKSNLEYRNFNPPQRVVGQAINDRLSIIQKANKQAAGRLDEVANSLKGQKVDVSPAMDRFVERLAGERINVNPNGKLNFTGSSIEGRDLQKVQRIISGVYNRLRFTEDPSHNALRVHDAKKFIDEQVSYGKTQAGLSGRMEHIVKELRHNLDEILDRQFPEYDRVNTMYAETRGVIDELQSLAGQKVDLTGVNVDKALGVMSRKVLSNYNTGTATEDLFKQLDDVAARYSTPLDGGLDDELLKIVSAEAEFRKMFPTASKPNTFQGEIGTEIGRAAISAGTGGKSDALKWMADKAAKVFSKDEEAKLQALKDLLSE